MRKLYGVYMLFEMILLRRDKLLWPGIKIWLIMVSPSDTIENLYPLTCFSEIIRTKLRLHRCRVRMKMDDIERVRDARADHNLDDVQRFPPPWDLRAAAS